MMIHAGGATTEPTAANLKEIRDVETIDIDGNVNGKKLPVSPARLVIYATFVVP